MTKQSFEAAYERLEEILEKMNNGQVSLDHALKLYEEADGLIRDCQSRLIRAEQKVEMLIKNREGDLKVGENGEVQKEDFLPSRGTVL